MMTLSLRLTHKIIAIGIVGLSGLLGFGAIYQVGSWSQDASRVVAREGRALSDLNKDILIKMLEARRAEKDFQLRRDEAYSKRHSETSAGIDQDLEKLKSTARASGFNSILEKVETVQRGYANYAKSFSGLVQADIRLGLNEKLGLTGSLRAAVHDIETKLKEIDDPRLTSSMLMMRRHEKDFMLRRDEKYVAELKKTAADFSKSLASAEIQPALNAEIAKKLEKYQADFSSWAEGALEVARHAPRCRRHSTKSSL
jgi:methyl-accepting chemotaxis protein